MRPIRARKPLSQVGKKWVGAVQLVLAALSLRFYGTFAPLQRMRGSFGDELAPAGSVGGKKLPGLSADIEVF